VYGARPLRRAIQRELENPLAKRLLAAEFVPGDSIVVDATPQGTLSFNGSAEPAGRARASSAPGSSPSTVH
jgi:ATP-dependent Clp protease ATP-binding subunit ClpB